MLALSSSLAQPAPTSPVLWAEDALSKVMVSATGTDAKAARLTLSGARREITSGQAAVRQK